MISSPGGDLGGAAVGAHVENAVGLGDAFEVGLLTSEGGGGTSGVSLVGGGFALGGSGSGPVSGGFGHCGLPWLGVDISKITVLATASKDLEVVSHKLYIRASGG